MLKSSESGQGLIEYALVLILVAVVVIACMIAPLMALIALAVGNWDKIVNWGSNLVAGIQEGNPSSIFVAVLIVVVLLAIIFRRRRN